MKKIIITQSNYIPWKGYFDSINEVDEFIIYDDMQFTRRDWRNRNKIKTPQGSQWITIPVDVKGKFFQKINETKVSEKGWAKDHWKTIAHTYSKAPHFKEFKDFFENLYLNLDSEFLTEINYLFLSKICGILGINTLFKLSSDFELVEDKTERLVDLCKKVGATDYFSGPAAKEYMNESLFNQEGIKVHYFDYSNYPVYSQLYGEFDHAVTILDLIFNEGNNSINFMKSFNNRYERATKED